jgi:hypothetical protein
MAQVFTSAIIPAPAADVWEKIRDFNALPRWHPVVRDSRILDGMRADQVGCVRDFHLQNGDGITEQLVALSDYDMTTTYTILESPMPVTGYVATLRLTPVTDGDRTFAEWSAEFDCPEDEAQELVAHIGDNVFQAGFDSLKRHFGQGA